MLTRRLRAALHRSGATVCGRAVEGARRDGSRSGGGDEPGLVAIETAAPGDDVATVISDEGLRQLQIRERKVAVARGYEQIAARYTAAKEDRGDIQEWVDALAEGVPAGGRILDMGCGAGVPYSQRLARRFQVVGIDIAVAQLRLARGGVGGGQFVRGDICALPFAAGTFDAALCLYAIIHVPRVEHPRVLAEAYRVLRPGGALLVVMGAGPLDEDWGEYHGARMHWSHYGTAVSRRLVEGAGFAVGRAGIVADPPSSGHLFVLAVK